MVRCKWLFTLFSIFIALKLLADASTTNINQISTDTNTGIDVQNLNGKVTLRNGRIPKNDNDGDVTVAPVTFHLAFTVPKFTRLNQRCIESIFYFHPSARVILHSNAKHGIHTADPQLLKPIQRLIDLGYQIEIIPYNAADLLQRAMDVSDSIVDKALAKQWISLIASQYSHEEYWYSNETNLLRMSILYVTGGIYLDTDVVVVRPLVVVEPSKASNPKSHLIKKNDVTDNVGLQVDNVMARDNEKFECAVMKFLQPGNVFLGHALNNFLRNYNGTVWGNNGPNVFGRVSDDMPHLLCPEPYDFAVATGDMTLSDNGSIAPPCYMQPLPGIAFQPVPWWELKDHCYDPDKSPVGIEASSIISKPNVYAVHLNNHIFGDALEQNSFVPDSMCDITLKNFCILCEQN